MLFFDLFRNDPRIRSLPAGDVLFREGEPGDCMYVLVAGSAEIRVGERVVEVANCGTILGEMAVLDASLRSATVITKTKCDFAEIDKKRFRFLVDETPMFAIEVMRVMAQRLRQADQSLARGS